MKQFVFLIFSFFLIQDKGISQYIFQQQKDTAIVWAAEITQDFELDENNKLTIPREAIQPQRKLLKFSIEPSEAASCDITSLTTVFFNAIYKKKIKLYKDSLCVHDTSSNALQSHYIEINSASGCAMFGDKSAKSVRFYRLKAIIFYNKNTKKWQLENIRIGAFGDISYSDQEDIRAFFWFRAVPDTTETYNNPKFLWAEAIAHYTKIDFKIIKQMENVKVMRIQPFNFGKIENDIADVSRGKDAIEEARRINELYQQADNTTQFIEAQSPTFLVPLYLFLWDKERQQLNIQIFGVY